MSTGKKRIRAGCWLAIFLVAGMGVAAAQDVLVVNTLVDPADNEIDYEDEILSLREAILLCNLSTDYYHIVFDESLYSATEPGTIHVQRPLPALLDVGTVIEGPLVDATASFESRIRIRIMLQDNTSTTVAGTTILPILSGGNVIRNLGFCGGRGIGVFMFGRTAVGNVVSGCLFGQSMQGGVTSSGARLLFGVYIGGGSSQNSVGEDYSLGGNAFVNCELAAVMVDSPECRQNVIQRNIIGPLTAEGLFGPNGTGVWLRGVGSLVGGARLSNANVICGNEYNGVLVDGFHARENTISRNMIYGNGNLGIDLSYFDGTGDGPNPFLAWELKPGPNMLVPAPILYSYEYENVFNLDRFRIHGLAPAGAEVEIFEAERDDSGYGEGKRYLGATSAAADGYFSAEFFLTPGSFITLTATLAHNSSEFSQCLLLEVVPEERPVIQLQMWENLFFIPTGAARYFGADTNYTIPDELPIEANFYPENIATIWNDIIIRDTNYVIFPVLGEAPGLTFLELSVPPELGGAASYALFCVDDAQPIDLESALPTENSLDGVTPFRFYRFTGEAGDIVNVTVEALASPVSTTETADLAVHVFNYLPYDLGFNNDYRGSDAYTQVFLPETGEYYIAVQDIFLRSGVEFPFRLTAWREPRVGDFTPVAATPTPVTVNDRPRRLAGGDMDSDGFDDVLAIFEDSPVLAVLRQLPRDPGAFEPPLVIDLDFYPDSITIHDLNGDGRPDVMLTDAVSGELHILYNDKRFAAEGAAKRHEPLLHQTVKMAAGEGEGVSSDFNQDEFADYAFMNSAQALLQIFLNDGTGNLTLQQTLAVGQQPVAMDTADFNGDNVADIAVADVLTSQVYVFRGQGNGEFEEAKTLGLAAAPTDLKSSDLDNDGLADILVCTAGAGLLKTFRALPAFQFENYQDLAAGTDPNSIAVADLNADGLEDVAVANSGSQDIYLYQGIQQGLLIPAAISGGGGEIRELLWLAFGHGGGYIGLSPDEEFIQVVEGAYRILDFPISESTTEMATAFALANPAGAGDALVYFSLYDEDGTLIEDPNVENPVVLAIDEGRQIAFFVSDIFGDGLTEYRPWMRAVSLNVGLQGFFLLTSLQAGPFLDGALAQTEPQTRLILPINESVANGGDSHVTLINPADAPAAVTLRCLGPAGESLADDVQFNLNAGGRHAFSFCEQYPHVTGTCYLSVSAGRPLEGFQYGGNEGQISATAAMAVAEETTAPVSLVGAHFAVGRLYRSVLDLFNTGTAPCDVVVHAFHDDGSPITSSAPLTIPAGGLLRSGLAELLGIDWQGTDAAVGFLRVDGSRGGLLGTLTFGDRAGQGFSSTLVLPQAGRAGMLFSHVAVGEHSGIQYFTGLTILNPGPGNATATVTVYDEFGLITGQGQVTLPPGTKLSQMLPDFVPGLGAQVKGYITVTAQEPEAALFSFALFGDSQGQFMSAIPPQPYGQEQPGKQLRPRPARIYPDGRLPRD
ncbi:MAG: VCBS repeat-containing protein [Acidobacteria bacterium]|nr:VCBS repeat-containing protein [Acidobacteriota bacterium]